MFFSLLIDQPSYVSRCYVGVQKLLLYTACAAIRKYAMNSNKIVVTFQFGTEFAVGRTYFL